MSRTGQLLLSLLGLATSTRLADPQEPSHKGPLSDEYLKRLERLEFLFARLVETLEAKVSPQNVSHHLPRELGTVPVEDRRTLIRDHPGPPPSTVTVPSSVSFVATSKPGALKAQKFKGQPVHLETAFFRNAAFTKAFEPPKGSYYRFFNRPIEKSVTIIKRSGEANGSAVCPASWGLVSAVVEAYNQHHELILRPDDLWQAILTQFSFYVNAHSEALREKFVNFSGRKQLVIRTEGSLKTADYGLLARRMVDENIVANIKDPEVAQWLIPSFSTTTEGDRVAASVTLMSTFQAYFEYGICIQCGIPKVTLLGTVEDWKELSRKVDRLPGYDADKDRLMTRWHFLLKPVLGQFVESAAGNPDLYFWDRVCSHIGGGSGPSFLSGWVTVFAPFSIKGFWAADDGLRPDIYQRPLAEAMPWPVIDTKIIPVGAVSVPVLVEENGIKYEMQMVAGQVAYEACGPDGVALRPRTDWCIACKS